MGLYTAESVLPGKTKFDINTYEKTVLIEKATTILDPRRDHLIAQFNRLGLFARQLDTQEIIQNFYINYNPESMEGQEVTNSESYTTPIVRASLAEEQNSNQIRENFFQTLTDKVGQNVAETEPAPTNEKKIKDEEPIQKEAIVSSNEEAVAPLSQQITSTPNFSEEISSLQTNTNQQIANSQETKQAPINQTNEPYPNPSALTIKKTDKPNLAEL
jgi:hypothetical protein